MACSTNESTGIAADLVGSWEARTLVMVCDCDRDNPLSFATEFDAGTVTLTTTDAQFDFNGDGTEEPAQVVVVLARP